MPVVDRREFGGRFTVRENSQRLANYRYLEIQLMEMIAGWCHTTPQLAFKATFGYHVYDHAQAADLLGERLEQLRSTRDSQEPATDEFARLCESVWKLDDTVDRLVAVYRVLEPHLVSTYVYHADATDPLADTPTVRLLRQLAAMGQSHVAWGQAVLGFADPGSREAAPGAGRAGRHRGAAGRVRRRDRPGHRIALADVPQRPGGGQAQPALAPRRTQCYRFAKTLPAAGTFRGRGALSGFQRIRKDFEKAYTSEDEWSIEGFRHKFHQLLYGEVETTDRMGKMLAEFPDLPWEMRMELAHQMWDEARHIEIVAKVCEEELGATLGYGPWPLAWWWMQNETDPLRRISVTNSWAEAQPDAAPCASGASRPKSAATRASPSCATTCRPTS